MIAGCQQNFYPNFAQNMFRKFSSFSENKSRAAAPAGGMLRTNEK